MENCTYIKSTSISINTDCNGNCPYCFQQNYHGQHKYMSINEFKNILDWCGPLDKVKLLGGEPTLHPYFIDFVKELINRRIQPEILTNASTYNPKLWADLSEMNLQYLINCNHEKNLDQVFIDNLKILVSNKIDSTITIGITLLGDTDYDQYSIDFLQYIIAVFSNVPFVIRIGLATPYAGEYTIIDYSNSINQLLDIVDTSFCTLKLDCHVNCCNFDYKTFGRMLYDEKVFDPTLVPCLNPLCAIRLDGSVLYCDSLDDIRINHYSECKDLNECENILKRKRDELMADLSIDFLCNNGSLCSNPICSGPCPAILNKLHKQSLEVQNG